MKYIHFNMIVTFMKQNVGIVMMILFDRENFARSLIRIYSDDGFSRTTFQKFPIFCLLSFNEIFTPMNYFWLFSLIANNLQKSYRTIHFTLWIFNILSIKSQNTLNLLTFTLICSLVTILFYILFYYNFH